MLKINKVVKETRGQSATEFIIALPLVLFFIIAVIQLIIIANAYFIADYAAFASSRVFASRQNGALARLAARRICESLPEGNMTEFIVIRDDTTFGFPTARTYMTYRLPIRLPLLGSLGPAVNVRGTSTVGLSRW